MCSIQAKRLSILVKLILPRWDVLLVTQEPGKKQNSMSQNDDPNMAIAIGIHSIEGPDVGFRGG